MGLSESARRLFSPGQGESVIDSSQTEVILGCDDCPNRRRTVMLGARALDVCQPDAGTMPRYPIQVNYAIALAMSTNRSRVEVRGLGVKFGQACASDPPEGCEEAVAIDFTHASLLEKYSVQEQ